MRTTGVELLDPAAGSAGAGDDAVVVLATVEEDATVGDASASTVVDDERSTEDVVATDALERWLQPPLSPMRLDACCSFTS
jgi:hypothetical protein